MSTSTWRSRNRVTTAVCPSLAAWWMGVWPYCVHVFICSCNIKKHFIMCIGLWPSTVVRSIYWFQYDIAVSRWSHRVSMCIIYIYIYIYLFIYLYIYLFIYNCIYNINVVAVRIKHDSRVYFHIQPGEKGWRIVYTSDRRTLFIALKSAFRSNNSSTMSRRPLLDAEEIGVSPVCMHESYILTVCIKCDMK